MECISFPKLAGGVKKLPSLQKSEYSLFLYGVHDKRMMIKIRDTRCSWKSG